MAAIGNRILELIKSRGMTQKEFSLKTGIPQSTISDWRGKGLNPNIDKIMVISKVLDISLEDLISGETETSGKEVDYICIDKDSPEYRLVMGYRKLGQAERARLEGYIHVLG